VIKIQRNDVEFDASGDWRAVAAVGMSTLEAASRDGTPMDFDDAIYTDPRLKDYLWGSQHYKCCYCEKPVGVKFQHVEHFRPKARARRSKVITTEGYWWLAYDVSNLLLSCPECNNYKRDWFPLEENSPSVAPGEDPLSVGELPTLIDPLREDPENHLMFVELPSGQWRIAGRTQRGWTTIDTLHLDSDALDKQRQSVGRGASRRRRTTLDGPEDVEPDVHFANLVRSALRATSVNP